MTENEQEATRLTHIEDVLVKFSERGIYAVPIWMAMVGVLIILDGISAPQIVRDSFNVLTAVVGAVGLTALALYCLFVAIVVFDQ